MTALRWLDGPRRQGVTWGVPWARGVVPAGTPFALADGTAVQTWTTATWPDGSVKWTAHAIGPSTAESFKLLPGVEPALPAQPVTVDGLTVSTGAVTWRLSRRGLLESIAYGSREVARDVRLVSLRQDTPDSDGSRGRVRTVATVERVTVEQDGPVRAVVRVEGRHGDWLPFTVRLYFYAGSPEVRLVHSFVWDGDPSRDFLAGLGLEADVPMSGPLHDRHVRLAGAEGFLTEAVRGLTGLRRDPGLAVRQAQVEGRAVSLSSEVAGWLHLIPAWNDYTLDQTSADGYLLRKRTAPGHAWVTIPSGTRSQGYGFVGGLGFGLRDFWRLHPTRLDIRGAATSLATVSVWMYSPSAPPMDLRFWHDGMGQDDHATQLEGLEITYEDYEPGFGDAHGIARTHELTLCAFDATPPVATLAEHALSLNSPGLLVAAPERLKEAGVFGVWDLPGDSGLEERLDWLFAFYAGQREQRRWYGFWDYGDVMHTYDADRHTWRYDVGGYAWDNSELSPDLWLWYQFLRTGRADVFRFAEAMSRHTGEVDVYHAGRWKGLGTRHNVQHWGCSCKQLRISNALYRRFFYYLTADERTGDLLDELSEEPVAVLDPLRKYQSRAGVELGPTVDWGCLAALWLTRWERHGDLLARDKLLGSMADIGGFPFGFLTGGTPFSVSTGRFGKPGDIVVSHLSAMFGLPEICAELIALVEVPGFSRAWVEYCRLYLATPSEQVAAVGQVLDGISLIPAHSRLTAYAAFALGDPALAERAWRDFHTDEGDHLGNASPLTRRPSWSVTRVAGPGVPMPVDEAPFVSTNDAAQWALAAIQLQALLAPDLTAPWRPL